VRIKLDENMPRALVEDLQILGHDIDTVPDEGLGGRADPEVWAAAQAEERFLITQDLDFSDLRKFVPGTHAGLLLVRLRAPGRQALRLRVASLFRSESVEEWARSFVVATERRLRIRRHP